VFRHFLFYVAASTRNRVRRQLGRLRSPRYAIAAAAGLLYFVLVFGGLPGGQPQNGVSGAEYIDAARAVGPVAVALLAAWWWLWGGHRTGLVLTPAETHLLVTAPLHRRALVRFKIMQAQAPILLSAGLGTLLTRGAALPWPLRLASLWLLLATLHQHQIAASLVHTAAEEQGRRGVRRHLLPILLFGSAFAVLAAALTRAVRDIRAAGLATAPDRLGAMVTEPAVHAVLTPFRLLLAPLAAGNAAAWAQPFAMAAGILVLHYLWLQRTDAAFEETAAAAGERRAARTAAVREGGVARLRFSRQGRPDRLSRPWLALPADGMPAGAILWKNLLYAQRLLRVRTVAVIAVAAAAIAATGASGAGSVEAAMRIGGFMLLMLALLAGVAGPLAVRIDLRMDLRHLELLRTLPVAGRPMMAAQVGGGALVITVLQLPLAGVGVVLLVAAGQLGPWSAAAALGLAAGVMPLLNAVSVAIQNALALLYPGWIRVGAEGSGGMEAVGQNMLTLFGTLLLLVLALAPPVVAAGVVAALLAGYLADGAWALAGLAGTALLAIELVLLVTWLGRLYDRTDPVDAGLV
jgi:ABC-2 type transport system permease protein